MRRDRRKKYEHRFARVRLQFVRIERRERKLIRYAPPAESGTVIVQGIRTIDLVETVEGAFGPALAQSGHDGNGAIAGALEQRHQRRPRQGHQQRVVVHVAHLHSGQYAQMREHRTAAKGG